MIKLSQSCLGTEEKDAVMRVLDKSYLGMGEETANFESELQDFIGSGVEVACVNSGTSALHLATQACGIKEGDEVIIPSLTYVASFQAVAATGAIPVACDVDLRTGCMDVSDVEKKITQYTKALMPVHYAGGFGDLIGIYDLAKKYNLRVIEDAAHSFGGYRNDKRVGAIGDIICFSFDGIKNITCGEGGAVVSSDAHLISKIGDLRLLAVEKDTQNRYAGKRSWDFDVKEQGWRYHMSNINAAIGRAQLKKIDQFAIERQTLWKQYISLLDQEYFNFLSIDIENTIPHIFPIIVKRRRDELREYLLNNNIETGLHYKPNHLLEKFRRDECKNAEVLWGKLLTLPLHCNLGEEEIIFISCKLNGFLKND